MKPRADQPETERIDRAARAATSAGAVVVAAALIGVMSDFVSTDGFRHTWRESSAVVRVISQPVAAVLDPVTVWSSSVAALVFLLWLSRRSLASSLRIPSVVRIPIHPLRSHSARIRRSFGVSYRIGGRYGP